MRLVVTFFSVFVIALATTFTHVTSAMAMERMSDASMMADMNMGDAGSPTCPPEMCAKMKACAGASSPVAVVIPAVTSSFAPGVGVVLLAQHDPDFHDPVSGFGLRRPPRFI